MNGYIWTFDVFSAEEIEASGNASSDAIDLRGKAPNDRFAIAYTVTGSGELRLEYLTCYYLGGTYFEPSEGLEIGAGIIAGSDLIEFSPLLTPFIKIKAYETGGAETATITAVLLTK